MNEYEGCKIINIRRGKTGSRKRTIYATLVDKNDKVLIGATLSYIVKALPLRLPQNSK